MNQERQLEEFSVSILESKSPVLVEDCIAIKLDGASISTIQELHDALKGPLYFPGDYGYSLDALFDVLIDLAWLNGRPVHLIINNFDYLLETESTERKIQGILTLIDAGRTWLQLTQQPELFNISVKQSNHIIPMLETCEVPYVII